MTGPSDRVAPREQDRDWRWRGACLADPDLHHPTGYSRTYRRQIDQARAMCREECPVLDLCRAWITAYEAGLCQDARIGVWAAMTPEERWRADIAVREQQSPGTVPVQTCRRTGGRPFDPLLLAEVARLRADDLSARSIAQELGITTSSAYRAIRHLDAHGTGSGLAPALATGDG